MANRRGRPTGHRLSEESKRKISISKTGLLHNEKTKKRISKGLKKYFKSPEGIAQKEKTSLFVRTFWLTNEGKEIRGMLSVSMQEHYNNHFRD